MVVVSPLLLLPAEQILVAQRNSAVVLQEDSSHGLMLFLLFGGEANATNDMLCVCFLITFKTVCHSTVSFLNKHVKHTCGRMLLLQN